MRLNLLTLSFLMLMSNNIYAEKSEKLNWKQINWPSLDYNREAVDGGVALYTLPSKGIKKFNLTIVFDISQFKYPQNKLETFNLAVHMLNVTGAGDKNYEQLVQYLEKEQITIDFSVVKSGNLKLNISALNSDFDKVLLLLKNYFTALKMDKKYFNNEVEQYKAAFTSFLDVNESSDINKFIGREISRYVFGHNHVLSKLLETNLYKNIDNIKYEDLVNMQKDFFNKKNANVVLSGDFSVDNKNKLLALLNVMPVKDIKPMLWLNGRTIVKPDDKYKVIIIKKKDMQQSFLNIRYYNPYMGKLNDFENKEFVIANNVFASSGGVVGNDRWSQAMRVDTGFSYSPYAYMIDNIVYPDTNLGAFYLVAQIPNNKIEEGLNIALNTVEKYIDKGITEEEFIKTKNLLINTALSSEISVFDNADKIVNFIINKEIINNNPFDTMLTDLENINDVSSVNKTLYKYTHDNVIKIIAITGNPDENQLKKITGNKFEIVKQINFEDLVNELKK